MWQGTEVCMVGTHQGIELKLRLQGICLELANFNDLCILGGNENVQVRLESFNRLFICKWNFLKFVFSFVSQSDRLT